MIETLRKIEEIIDQNKILEQRNEELRNIVEINLNQPITKIPASFAKTIDLTEIETLILKFYQFNKVSTAIFDDKNKLLFSVGQKPFCYKHANCDSPTKETCINLIKKIPIENSGRQALFHKCSHGINSIVIPIIVRKLNIASLIISQFLKEDDSVDELANKKYSNDKSIDFEKLKAEINKLPVFSNIEIEKIVNNATFLGEMLGYVCKKNYELYEKSQFNDDKELVLSALRDKIYEQEVLLKNLYDNILAHQIHILDTTISKTDQFKEINQLHKKIERTETLLNTLLTTIPLGIGFVRKNIFTYVNDQMVRLTGYTGKELIGRSPEFLFSEGISGNIFKFAPEYYFIRSNNSFELQLNQKNGHKIETIVFSAPLNMEDPDEGWIVSILEITAMKEIQKELLLAKEKAEESDRLKNAFLSNMSHELRTPMNALVGFTELLSLTKPDEKKRKEYFIIIQQSSKKLLGLIDDIIDVSMITTNQLVINKRNFSLHVLMEDMNKIYSQYIKDKFGNNLNLILTIPEKSTNDIILTDDIRLRKILSNLLSNAIKFTTKGQIEFGYYLKGALIEFFVRDTGSGIKKAQTTFIFDRFRQGDDTYTRLHGGTGLGLTLAKNFVELMGGTIWFESRFGKGSTFYFTLPASTFENIKINNESEVDIFNLKRDWSDKTILIAEDEEINFLYLQHLLMPTNINIKWAKNGQTAIDCFNQNPEINLILMDIKMPIINGLEATRVIKSKNHHLPIIAQTAYAHGHNREDFINAGCDEYIPKPINSKLLIRLLEKFLNKN